MHLQAKYYGSADFPLANVVLFGFGPFSDESPSSEKGRLLWRNLFFLFIFVAMFTTFNENIPEFQQKSMFYERFPKIYRSSIDLR